MHIVITTIFPPTLGARELSAGLARLGGTLWVMGDRKGPFEYDLPSVRFFDIDTQHRLAFKLTRDLPEKHYTRKNLGYLLAIQAGARAIVETDDDNIPKSDFWRTPIATQVSRPLAAKGWCNVYRLFSREKIWPRGFPLEHLQASFTAQAQPGLAMERECLIQQGLADQNPDVDAVYRLTGALPVDFEKGAPVHLGPGVWCPFNSQNTTFFPAAFPLLYLPSYCTFRMTDIWRSFVAQRCLWEMDSALSFSEATVYQERNEHNLLRDFEDEVPGYLKNEKIRQVLESLSLAAGREITTVCANLLACYEALVRAEIVGARELPLVQAWIQDLLDLNG